MNTNQLITKRKLDSLKAELRDKVNHLKQLDSLLRWSFVLTFLLYFAFALSLYVGDIFNIKTIVDSFVGGAYSLAFFGVIAALLAYVLAATKHVAYKHFSMFGAVKTIVLLMVFTGILAEVFNSGGVQDSKARSVIAGNEEYQTLISEGSGASIQLDEGLTSRIAYAQKILARCETKLAAGKEKHCNGDKAKLSALLASQETLISAQMKATKDNQSERYDRLDAIKDDGYNPVIKTLSKLLDIEIAQAVSLLMLLFACLFEAMHYYLSIMRENTIFAITGIREALDRLEIDLISFSADDVKQDYSDDRVSDFPEENRNRWNSSNNVTAKRQDFVGFVNPNQPTNLRVPSNTPERPIHAYRTRNSSSVGSIDTRNTVKPDTRNTGKSDTRKQDQSESDYGKLKKLIINKDLSVTYRPIKIWMKAESIGTSDKKRQDLTMQYLDKMFAEGILRLNPANNGSGINKAKYVLA